MTTVSSNVDTNELAAPNETRMLRLLRIPLVVAMVALAAFAWETGTDLSQSVAAIGTSNSTLADVTSDENASDTSPAVISADKEDAQAESVEARPAGEQGEVVSAAVEVIATPITLNPTHVFVQAEPPTSNDPESVVEPFRRPAQAKPFPSPSTVFDADDGPSQADQPPLPADTAFLASSFETDAVSGDTKPVDVATETTNSRPADPTLPEDITPFEPLVLTNSANSHAAIRFLVNGQLQTLEPGASYRETVSDLRRIQFHRGGEYGNAEESFPAGNYTFHVTERGWTLAPSDID